MSQVISDYAQITRLSNFGTLPFQATTLTLTPGVSSQPVSNGEITVDFPADTRVRWSAKGSDGQTRWFTLPRYNYDTNSLSVGDVGNIYYDGSNTIAAWNTVVIGQQAANGTGVSGVDRLTDTVVIGAYAGNKFKHGNGNAICGNRSMQDIVDCSHNTAYGDSAWRFATSGTDGTAVGYVTGQDILSLNGDVFIGSYTGCYGTSTDRNVYIGFYAAARATGQPGSLGSFNVAIGNEAMRYSLASTYNIAIGNGSLYLTTGSSNIAIGNQASANMSSSSNNISVGPNAAQYATLGDKNILIGLSAGARTSGTAGTIGTQNIGIGELALKSTTVGYCIGIGGSALINSTGASNIGIGYRAGEAITTGSTNTIIGTNAGYTTGGLQKVDAVNSTAIGNLTYTTKSNQAVLGNSSVTETILRGKVQWNAPASAVPDDIGQITFEFTNNTTVTIKGKGSDGTVRSGTVTLS